MELEAILRDENGRKHFMEFLVKEYSQENLEFWIKCQEFKRITNKKQMKKCCEQIYNKYISLQGSHAVNIDHRARKMVEDNLKKPQSSIFDEAESQIFQLMQSDSFTRFLQSELFCAFKGTAKGNPKEDSPQLSTSSRKRKLTASSEYKSHLNQYNVHTYENESMIKSAKLSNESFLARSNVASLSQNTPTFQPNKQQLLDPRNQNPTLIGLENICSQNAFLFSGPEDLCDSESLYCNAPIYDMDAPTESSQPPKRPLHNRVMIDPKWFNNRFIRVVFPDCSEEFISISQKLPIRALVDALLVKKNFNYTSYKMFSIQTNEAIDLDKDISSIVFNDARIEQRITFSMHFPEGYLIKVETLPNRLAFQTMQAILAHFGISWQDIELHDDHGHLLNSSLLMEPAFNLDHTGIHVHYLSSLRTYLNLNDINDLNEDGITIRSIQFGENGKPKASRKSTVPRANLSTLPQSFCTFAVESPYQAKIRPTQQLINEKNMSHLYSNVSSTPETKDIDIGNLSFSNDTATNDFLAEVMSCDISKLNFICTPQKSQTEAKPDKFAQRANVYENLCFDEAPTPPPRSRVPNHYSEPRKENTPVHKARFVIIDENEYNNVLESQSKRSKCQARGKEPSDKPLYSNQGVDFDERFCDCRPKTSAILKSSNRVPNDIASQPSLNRPLRRLSQVPRIQRQQVESSKACSSPISFTKYLLQSTSSPTPLTRLTANNANNQQPQHTSGARPAPRMSLSASNNFSNNFTNFCITPLKANKPDLLVSTNSSNKRSRMSTLSRFHKII